MDCFDYTFYGIFYYRLNGGFSLSDTNVLTRFMISLFLAIPAARARRARNLMGKSIQNGLTFFLLFGKKYYFIQMFRFLINNLFRNIFQTLGVIGVITLLHVRNSDPKKYFNSWKKYFLFWNFIENQVFIISALFLCFSVFSLFKLMKLV